MVCILEKSEVTFEVLLNNILVLRHLRFGRLKILLTQLGRGLNWYQRFIMYESISYNVYRQWLLQVSPSLHGFQFDLY